METSMHSDDHELTTSDKQKPDVRMETSMHSDDNDFTSSGNQNNKPDYFHSDSTGHEALTRRLSRRASLKRRESSSRFSILMSTEEFNRESSEKPAFYGPYSHIRRKLDYDYHVHYKKERQWLQDSIVEDCLFDENKEGPMENPKEPWLLFTVGVQGAGKRYTLVELIKDGRLPLLSYVYVDPHDIRRRLPEFESYLQKCDYDCVDELTRKEAGYISELIVRAALQSGRNVVWDTSFHSAEWFLDFARQVKDEFSSVKVGILHISAPRDVILERVEVCTINWRNVNNASSCLLL